MNPKGIQHEALKLALNNHFVKNTPEEFRVIPETMFRMSEDTFVEPDFIFFRSGKRWSGAVHLYRIRTITS